MGITFELDHIISRSAGGSTELDNLCLSCPSCNRYKATRFAALDPSSAETVPLLHPLKQAWRDHFVWIDNGSQIFGLTPTGRATVATLRMNRTAIVNVRRYWVVLGLHPPAE